MNTPIKLAIGLGTLGATGGGAYLLHQQLSSDSTPKKLEQENLLTNNSIEKVLTDKGYELLSYDTSKEEGDTWNPIVKAYSNSKTKFKGVDIKIAGDSGANPTKANVDALKEACKQFIATSKNNVTNLKTAEQFCVKPIAIKDLIAKNRTVLDSTSTTDLTPELWNKKVSDYFASPSDKRIANVSLTDSAPAGEKEKRDALKKGCDGIGKKLTHEDEYHKLLSQFEELCSNPK